MSEQNQAPQNEELDVEELEDVAGGVVPAEEASTNIGCTNYGCS